MPHPARPVLPDVDGVGPSCVALPQRGPWPTMLAFLAERFDAIPPQTWQDRMARGEVRDEHGQPLPMDAPYRAGTRLYYYRSLPAETPIPFDETVLFQDDYLVAVDKPHFLPVTPAGRYVQESLLVRLKRRLGAETLAPIHRLDRETAGVVLFTLQPDTRGRYQALFRERRIKKYYEAIAPCRPDLAWPVVYRSRLEEGDSFMTMREAPGTPNSETRIELLHMHGDLARYGLHPVTGQKHQLRVHMAALGMPILHDQIYPRLQPALKEGESPDYSRPLQLLAKSLSFTDPVTGQDRSFESPRHLLP